MMTKEFTLNEVVEKLQGAMERTDSSVDTAALILEMWAKSKGIDITSQGARQLIEHGVSGATDKY